MRAMKLNWSLYMTNSQLKDALISALIIGGAIAVFFWVQFQDWKDETKQVCIETHLYANKAATMVLCGKLASL